MGKKIVLGVAISLGVLCGGGAAYASIFGEENIPLYKQLAELLGIHAKTKRILAETREGIDMARDIADDTRRAKALVADLQSYTTDRFIEDFKRDILQTYPDLDYIIRSTSASGLRAWRQSEMGAPMGSYELIGKVFGEATAAVQSAQEEGLVKMEGAVLYRYEAATSLAVAEDASRFIDAADSDIDVLVEQLNGATKEEAIVLQAKLQAVVAAQNSHMLRLMSRLVRREGVEDARNYRGAINRLNLGLQVDQGQRQIWEKLNERPELLKFDHSWLDLN